MDWIADPQAWIALGTLAVLEIVLGIDNIVFISILAAKLPPEQQANARRIGLLLATVMRIGLLLSLEWIMRLTEPLFAVLGHKISGRDLILIFGGLFLLAKSTHEIHQKLEGDEGSSSDRVRPSFGSMMLQVVLLDAVFSLDSVITAVGMADQIAVMVIAVVIAVAFMMIFASSISRFVEKHPTVKILALSFLLLVGAALIAEGFNQHIPKGYIYFAMAFSVFIEFLNQRLRKPKTPPIKLHEPYVGHDNDAEPNAAADRSRM